MLNPKPSTLNPDASSPSSQRSYEAWTARYVDLTIILQNFLHRNPESLIPLNSGRHLCVFEWAHSTAQNSPEALNDESLEP